MLATKTRYSAFMRTKSITIHCLYLMIALLLVTSCQKDDTNPLSNAEYLVEYEKINTLSTLFINNLYTSASLYEPDIALLKDSVNYNVEVYEVKYRTRFKGEEIVASGLVSVPEDVGYYPIVSFQNGTNTSHANAPTSNPSSTNFLLLTSMATNGYIFLIPDYIGFGASEDILHPYYDKESSNRAVIDLLYAAQELVSFYDGDAFSNDQYFLMGYSQGGWATLAALEELENNPNYSFDILGTSCGAGAYNLLKVSEYILQQDNFPGPLYLPYFIQSHYQLSEMDGELNHYFNEPYASRIPSLFDGSYINSSVDDQLTDSIAELLTYNFVNNFSDGDGFSALRSELNKNSIEPWVLSSPVHFYHGNADLNVPPFESENIYTAFSETSGELVSHYIFEGLNHETSILPWGVQTILWFNQLKSMN